MTSNNKSNKPYILMIGESPKQLIHGISLSNQLLANILNERLIWLIESNSFTNAISRRILKLPQILSLIFQLRKARAHELRIFYTPLSVSLGGLIKTSLLINQANKANLKIILHVHRGDFTHRIETGSSFYQKIVKWLFNISHEIIVLSPQQKDSLSKYFKKVIHVLPNTVEIEEPCRTYHKKVSNFLYLSNLIKEKGYQDLIGIFNHPDNAQLNLNLSGSFGTKNDENFIRKISRLNIKYLGITSGIDKLHLLNSSECFILPSYNEGQPISILEAMSRGILVIATNVGCIPDMLPSNYPFLFTPGDINELSRHIQTISNLSTEELMDFSFELRSQYENNFSKTQFHNKVLSIFRVEK